MFYLECGCTLLDKMEIKHIGVNILQPEEIDDFYIDILGMEKTRSFTLSENLSSLIFKRPESVEVCMLQKDNVVLEIFIADVEKAQGYPHLCISLENREETWYKAQDKNYECIRIARETSDLVFIKDKAGNVFELKESGYKLFTIKQGIMKSTINENQDKG